MLFQRNYDRPGPGIPTDAPEKKGVALYGAILIRELFEMVKLNLLYLLFCLPLVTIPAASTALCRVTLAMVRDSPRFLWVEFRDAFKGDFIQSTIAGALYFFGVAAASCAVWFYLAAAGNNPVFYLLLAVALLVLLVLVMAGLYLFPLIALVDLPLRAIGKNALLLVFACLPRSLLALVCCGVMLFLAVAFFPLSIPVVVLLWPALINFTTTFCVYGGIRDHVLRQE